MKKILIITLSLFVIAACSKDEESAKTNGEVVLSSQIMGDATNYYVEGFSFENAKKVNYNLTSATIPDLVLENSLDISGDVTGANLASPQNETAFFKAGEFATLQEAEIFFNNLAEAGTNVYAPTANNIAANQVYIFQSRSNKFAKILIKEYKLVPGVMNDHVQATIDWVYQPNGEKLFAGKK